jgi:hypothetical protein
MAFAKQLFANEIRRIRGASTALYHVLNAIHGAIEK